MIWVTKNDIVEFLCIDVMTFFWFAWLFGYVILSVLWRFGKLKITYKPNAKGFSITHSTNEVEE